MRPPTLRRGRAGWMVVALAALVSGPRAAHAEPLAPPKLARSGGRLALTLESDLLAVPEVSRHLLSGLTTGFVIRIAARDPGRRRAEGLARVEIRFELWDEVYLARSEQGDARHWRTGEAVRLADRKALEAWWSALELELAAAAELDASSPWQLKVELDVLPYSAAEASDAERWFSDSIASRRDSAEVVNQADAAESSRLAGVLDLVMATSLERTPVLRYSWNLVAPPPRADATAGPGVSRR